MLTSISVQKCGPFVQLVVEVSVEVNEKNVEDVRLVIVVVVVVEVATAWQSDSYSNHWHFAKLLETNSNH